MTHNLQTLFTHQFSDITTVLSSALSGVNSVWRGSQKKSDNLLALVEPRSVDQLRNLFSVCGQYNIGVVPLAGGTSLTNGHAIGSERGKPCILVRPAFETVMRFENGANGSKLVTVSPDVTARDIELENPLYQVPVNLGIGSKGGLDNEGRFKTATIAGYLANNAAGTAAFRHGRAIDMVESVTAMKADGSLWTMNRGDLLLGDLIGMGGTTGFITEATIRLRPVPKKTQSAVIKIDHISQMYDLLESCKRSCWPYMEMFERMNDNLFEEVVRMLERENTPITSQIRPDKDKELLFLQLAADDEGVDLRGLLKKALDDAGLEAALFSDGSEHEKEILSYRVINASVACERLEHSIGGVVVGCDISSHLGNDAPFIHPEFSKQLEMDYPGIHILYFGHAAGVNFIEADSPRGGTALHYNPVLPAELKHLEYEVRGRIYQEAAKHGWIISEHTRGTKLIGAFKEHHGGIYDNEVDLKKRLDPLNLLNPGAFFYPADLDL